MFGVQTVEGADYVGSLDAEDFVRYDLNIPAAGSYLMALRVSSPLGGGSFIVGNAETRSKYATVYNIPVAVDTKRWQTIQMTVDLPLGYLPLEIRSSQSGWNLKEFSLKPFNLLNTMYGNDFVEAEDAEILPPTNVSIRISVKNPVPSFFAIIAADDYVSMQGGELQASSEGLDNIGWLDPSDYVIYNIALPYSGTYDFKTRISSPGGEGAFQIINNETLDIYAEVSNLPRTGDWQIWQTISNPVNLPGGLLSLRFVPLQQGWNLIWFSFELLAIDQSPSPSQTPSSTPTSLASLTPTGPPSSAPVQTPTATPTVQPTLSPTIFPIAQPTRSPLGTPTWSPREEAPRASRSEIVPVEETTRASSGRQDPNPDTWF